MYNWFVKRALWIGLLGLCLWLVAACEPEPTPTASPTPSLPPPTLTATSTALPPTDTPFPTLTPTAKATPTPVPTPTPTSFPPLPPLFIAPGIYPGSWSPDGRYFSYLSQTQKDLESMPVGEGPMDPPPGSYNFFDILTGQSCQYPERNTLFLNFRYGWIGWTGGHVLQVLTDKGYPAVLDDPCAGQPVANAAGLKEPVSRVLAVSSDRKLALLAGGTHCWLYAVDEMTSLPLNKCSKAVAFSPGDTRLAITINADPDFNTYIFQTGTGKLVTAIPSKFTGLGVGALTGPDWISEEQLLIQPTDAGTLLVALTTPPQVQPFPPASFNQPAGTHVDAFAMLHPDSNVLHIIFHVRGSAVDQYYLYHAENHILEALQYAYVNWLDSGRSLLLCKYGEPYVCQTYWEQAVDPPGSQPQPAPGQYSWYPVVSPDGKLAANTSAPASGSPVSVVVRSLPAQTVLQYWTAGKDSFLFAWSPDSSALAVVRWPIDPAFYGGGSSLYLLKFPH